MSIHDLWRSRVRIGLAIFYGAAGCLHVLLPAPFLSITPAWVPFAPLVILATGLCEIAGALGVCFLGLRKPACIGLALYAVCVFPANIKHALDSLGGDSASALAWIYHSIRLPLQPILVWLPLYAGRLIIWPFSRKLGK